MKKRSSSAGRYYTDQTLKLLWGRAAGRCAVPICRIELYVDKNEHDPIVPIGDIAHMHSHSDSGPRALSVLSAKQRNDYENLILLCKNCHFRLDGQKNTNTVEVIRQLKYNHEAWVRASLPERGRSRVGWHAIVIGEDQWPIDSLTFDAALSPDYIVNGPERLNATLDEEGWPDVAPRIRAQLAAVLRGGDSFEKRIAVFPLARVTACLYAGYVLTNRPNVQLFQYHRDEHTWVWPTNGRAASDPQLSIEGNANPEHILFAFELSARVDAQPLLSKLRSSALVRIAIDSPTTRWLQHPQQLRDLGSLARDTFESALARSLPSTVWHILYAGPAPGAVIVGQQLNPTMTPRTQLYEYVHPNHVPSLILEGES
jgi:SMODS-associated and fused to various effectors sensor domain